MSYAYFRRLEIENHNRYIEDKKYYDRIEFNRSLERILEESKNYKEYSDNCIYSFDLFFGGLMTGFPSYGTNFNTFLESNSIQQNNPNKIKFGSKGLNVGIDSYHTYCGYHYPFMGNKYKVWILESYNEYYRIKLETNLDFKYMYASRDKGIIYLDELQDKDLSIMLEIYKNQQLWRIIINNNKIYIFNKYRQQFLTYDENKKYLYVQNEPFGWDFYSL